jgi:hypothetical protein
MRKIKVIDLSILEDNNEKNEQGKSNIAKTSGEVVRKIDKQEQGKGKIEVGDLSILEDTGDLISFKDNKEVKETEVEISNTSSKVVSRSLRRSVRQKRSRRQPQT